MAKIQTISSLKDINDWYSDADHYAQNKYFDVIAAVTQEVEREDCKVLISVRDESVKNFNVLIDQTRWANAIDRHHEYGNGSIIFLQRAYVPKEHDILIAAFICLIEDDQSLSQSSSRSNHANSYPSWSPHHIIVANDRRIRSRIRELRNFLAEERQACESVEAGNATASRSLSLDSTRLSLDLLDSTDEETVQSREETASPEEVTMLSDESCEAEATTIEESLNSTLKDEAASQVLTIASDRVSPIQGDSPNHDTNSPTSSLQSEVYQDVSDHFSEDPDEHEVPYIDCLAGGKITSLRNQSPTQSFHLIKGILVECDDFEKLEEDDPIFLHNRLRLCNLITLFCTQCHCELTLRQFLSGGALSWLKYLRSNSVDEKSEFNCIECPDSPLAMSFKIVFHIQEILDMEPSCDLNSTQNRNGDRVKACLTGLSAILYFGKRPQEALLTEHSAESILDAVRIHLPEEGKFVPRFWYLLKLDPPIGGVDYSVISIVEGRVKSETVKKLSPPDPEDGHKDTTEDEGTNEDE